MMRTAQRMPRVDVRYAITQLGALTKGGQTFPGGLDLTTPSLALHPGALKDAVNFECCLTGGYARIQGYERVDGRTAPSDASFVIVQVESFTTVPAVGDFISQASSGATGTVAAVNNVAGSCYMVVTRITGTFDTTGVISTTLNLVVTAANSPFIVTTSYTVALGAGTTIGTATTTSVALTALLTAQYTAAAADIYRSLIQAVPGSGPVLGVVAMTFHPDSHLYAFRANAGGTAVNLYETSSAGWVQIPFFNTIEFTGGGTATPADGATLTQGGVTATVKRVMTRSGAWTGSAAGGFVITTPSAGSFTAGAATLTGGATVTLTGAQTAITMVPGGRFEFAKGNFGGQSSTRRIYGCDGANKAFEFDGTTLAPISTGAADDRPEHIAYHKNFLFLSFESSAMYCGAGTPFRWTAIDGGGEIAVGDHIHGMITLPGNQTTATLAIFQHQTTSFLYGTSSSTWQLINYNTGAGASAYSIQNLSDCFSFDDLGVVTLQTTLNFGNFTAGTLTENILPFIIRERSTVTASTINRTKGQYRVFFRDGYGLYMTISGKTYLGAIPVLFPNPVTCCDENKTHDGDEVSYFGSTDGYVYQLDKGNSFDGAGLYAFITLAWDAIKSPRVLKQFRAASIEVSGTGYAAFNFGYLLGYGSTNYNQPASVLTATNFSGTATWDSGINWDASGVVWDGVSLMPSELDMTGTAENVQVTIQSSTNYIAAYQVNSIIYHHSIRRGLRG